MARTRANNRAGLAWFEKELRSAGIEYVPSAANFLLVKVGDGQRVFVELQKRGIITRPMGGYRYRSSCASPWAAPRKTNAV